MSSFMGLKMALIPLYVCSLQNKANNLMFSNLLAFESRNSRYMIYDKSIFNQFYLGNWGSINSMEFL